MAPGWRYPGVENALQMALSFYHEFIAWSLESGDWNYMSDTDTTGLWGKLFLLGHQEGVNLLYGLRFGIPKQPPLPSIIRRQNKHPLIHSPKLLLIVLFSWSDGARGIWKRDFWCSAANLGCCVIHTLRALIERTALLKIFRIF